MIAADIRLAPGDGRRRRGPAGTPRRLTAPTMECCFMAIEVRIPTILRTYTGGAKSVEGSGATLAELLGDIDSRHRGQYRHRVAVLHRRLQPAEETHVLVV